MTRPQIDETHDPKLTTWVEGATTHPDFPVQNLPFGVFSPLGADARIGVAIGPSILDLRAAAELLPPACRTAVEQPILNQVFALHAADRAALRARVSALLSDAAYREVVGPLLHASADCILHLPARIGDYTDFYVGIHHATNVGKLLRPDAPLLPNYKWVPIGYHGRASSVRPSGTPVRRPSGQRKPPDAEAPVFGPSQRLDFELELGVWIGLGNDLGAPIGIAEAQDHVAGLTLLNDWSARDLQVWEFQPLGPFLAKSFLTTVSPWVVTAEALAPFRKSQPARPEGDPRPLNHLWDEADQAFGALALDLDVHLLTGRMAEQGLEPHRLSRSSTSHMYWTVAQMIAHHSSNGCNLNPGDLLGTGTLSGPTADSLGSLMEMSANGAQPLTLSNGEVRRFLEDGDEVILSAKAQAAGFASIGFGSCRGRVVAG